MEHTEANPCAVMPFFRVFGVFRGSLFSATRTPIRSVTLIARGLSLVSCLSLSLTTEQMEHTESNPCAVMPFFRVFGVFRGSLFSAPRTPQIRNPYRAGTVPGFLSFSLEEQIIPLAHLE